jgi:hypothetical protein
MEQTIPPGRGWNGLFSFKQTYQMPVLTLKSMLYGRFLNFYLFMHGLYNRQRSKYFIFL